MHNFVENYYKDIEGLMVIEHKIMIKKKKHICKMHICFHESEGFNENGY